MPIRLRPVLLTLLLLGAQKAYTQSSDVNAERVSIDAQILRSLDGSAPLMESSVFPQGLINLSPLADDSSDAFGRYVRAYYGGLMPGAPATEGMLAGEVLDGRWRGLVQVDDVLRFQADASLMLRGGTTTNDQNTKPFLLARPSVRFMGSMGGGLGYFLHI